MKSYNELIEELGKRLHIEIYPDIHNIVTLKIEKKVKIQLEIDSMNEFFLLGAYVSDLPAGKFRENILKHALKANHFLDKNPEILSYMSRENMLTLHRKFLLSSLTTNDLIKHIKSITQRAKNWTYAIEEGKCAPDDEIYDQKNGSKSSLFGL